MANKITLPRFRGKFLPPSASDLLDLPAHARGLAAEALRDRMAAIATEFAADMKAYDRDCLERAMVALMAAHRRISGWGSDAP